MGKNMRVGEKIDLDHQPVEVTIKGREKEREKQRGQ